MTTRIVVTGVGSSLGRQLAAHLASRPDVEAVWGVDHQPVHGAPATVPTEVVPRQFRELVQLLGDHRIDTVIHAALARSRSGDARRPRRADVIGTMHVAAAAGHRSSPVRTVVTCSSTEVYPANSHSPLLHPEDEALHPIPDTVAASLLEAEGYVRDLAQTRPEVEVSVLRLADLTGGGLTSPLSALLELPVVPVVAGYDPQVQLLHAGDAVAAVDHAARAGLTGTYNVAAEGSVAWSRAATLTRRWISIVPPLAVGAVEPVLQRLRVPFGPAAMLDVLRYGRCVATEHLRSTGFESRFSTRDCVGLLARGAR